MIKLEHRKGVRSDTGYSWGTDLKHASKSDTERPHTVLAQLNEMPSTDTCVETESRLMVAQGWRGVGRKGETLLTGSRI